MPVCMCGNILMGVNYMESRGSTQYDISPYGWIRCGVVSSAQMVNPESREYQMADGRTLSRVRLVGTVVFQRIFEPTSDETLDSVNGETRPKRRYGILVVDDGTGIVTVKAWGDVVSWLDLADLGSSVIVFGRLNLYRGEIGVIADLVRTIEDPNFEIYSDLLMLQEEKERGSRPGGPRPGEDSQLDQPQEEVPIDDSMPENSEEDIKEPPVAVVEENTEELEAHIETRGKLLNAIVVLDVDGEGVKHDDILQFVSGLTLKMLDETLARLVEDGDVYMPRRNIFRKV